MRKIFKNTDFADSYFPYKGSTLDSVLIRGNAGQRKPLFSHILCSDCHCNANTKIQSHFILYFLNVVPGRFYLTQRYILPFLSLTC